MFSGSASISTDVLEYFMSLDLPIQQVYGMSESTGLISMEFYDTMTVGSVGHAVNGVRVTLTSIKSEQEGVGEICIDGRNVFIGYLNEADKTKEAFDEGKV